jgi:hypothetical protein
MSRSASRQKFDRTVYFLHIAYISHASVSDAFTIVEFSRSTPAFTMCSAGPDQCKEKFCLAMQRLFIFV